MSIHATHWRNLTIGLVGGAALALCIGAAEDLKIKAEHVLVEVQAGTALAKLDLTKKNAQIAIDKLATELAAVKTIQKAAALRDCPDGYSLKRVTRTNGVDWTICTRGKDEMVKVGDFWIDRYEVAVVGPTAYNSGQCDKVSETDVYGGSNSDEQAFDKAGFPVHGNWTKPLYACSVSGVTASGFLSWLTAAQACALAGKQLCTNAQWQTAVAGTPDDYQKCQTGGKTPGSTEVFRKNGSRKCQSLYGAEDMIGNHWEMVADWWVTGPKVSASGASPTYKQKPWPSTFGDGEDRTHWIWGSVEVTNSEGMPAVARRGGDADTGSNESGAFAMDMRKGPNYRSPSVGTRCCVD